MPAGSCTATSSRSNLLLDHAGVVWIADFGLAKGEDEGLTQSGDILGTLRYMAPERFRGEGDARADIYALGLTLYELLTLRPGFDSSDRLKLIEQIKTEEPLKPRSVDARIPRDLETIVLKAIEKDPKARYQSAEAMGEDLRRFLADEPIRAPPGQRRGAIPGGGPGAIRLSPSLAGCSRRCWSRSRSARSWPRAVSQRWPSERVSWRPRERSARLEADQARTTAESAREAAQAESYHAVLSQVKALRAGHPLGWRDEALDEPLSTRRHADAPSRPGRAADRGRGHAGDTRHPPRDPDQAAQRQTFAPLFSAPMAGPSSPPASQGAWTSGTCPGNGTSPPLGGLNVTDVYEKTLVAFLPEARGLAVATRDHGVVFTDTRGIRTTRAPITRGSSQPKELAIDADGHWIAVAWTEPAGITVHDAASGALVDRFEDSPFALSPDGRWLARTEQGVIILQPLGSGGPTVELGRTRAGSSPSPSAPTRRCSPPHLWTTPRHSGTWRSVSISALSVVTPGS